MIRLALTLTCALLLLPAVDAAVAPAIPAGGPRLASVLRLPPGIPDVIVADTSSATLHLFSNVGGELRWRKAYYMSIGQNGVRKERTWDKKTPLGIYFISEEIDTGPLHEKYGVAAYALDYPNGWDRLARRSGYGIWLHGVDRRSPQRPPLDTDGCLAVPNAAILELADELKAPGIPVVVTDTLRWMEGPELDAVAASLADAVEQWRRSIVEGDLAGYLALYGDEFRHHGLEKGDWAVYRMQVFDNRQVDALDVDRLVLLSDPVESDLYLARFTQTQTGGEQKVTITKRLYWRRLPNNRWKIVAEETGWRRRGPRQAAQSG